MSNKPKKKSFLARIYLMLYNLVSSIGWLYVLYLTVIPAFSWKNPDDLYFSKNVYASVKEPLKILLVTAGLEIFHAAFRLVPSNPVIVFVQVFIRFLVIWGVCDVFPESQRIYGVFFVSLAWSLTEVIRYLYYFLNLTNQEFYLFKWLRYNLFIFLYPIGAFSEMIIIAYASFYIQPMSIRRKYSIFLPNVFNFSVDLFLVMWVWLSLYLPAFPIMYQHMLAQRKKCLYGKDSIKKAN